MGLHKIHNPKGEEVGWWNEEEIPRTYHTTRSYKRRQIFIHPKYDNAIGINTFIIEKYLKPNSITHLDFWVIGFERESFHAMITLKEFVEKSIDVNFDKDKPQGWGKQKILSLKYFKRIYPKQTRLI